MKNVGRIGNIPVTVPKESQVKVMNRRQGLTGSAILLGSKLSWNSSISATGFGVLK